MFLNIFQLHRPHLIKYWLVLCSALFFIFMIYKIFRVHDLFLFYFLKLDYLTLETVRGIFECECVCAKNQKGCALTLVCHLEVLSVFIHECCYKTPWNLDSEIEKRAIHLNAWFTIFKNWFYLHFTFKLLNRDFSHSCCRFPYKEKLSMLIPGEERATNTQKGFASFYTRIIKMNNLILLHSNSTDTKFCEAHCSEYISKGCPKYFLITGKHSI